MAVREDERGDEDVSENGGGRAQRVTMKRKNGVRPRGRNKG